LKDALKCGYNTAALTEVNFPAQDYRMISGFETTVKNFALPAAELEYVATGDDVAGNPPEWKIPYAVPANSVVLVYYKPIVMHYFVMNPSNSTICLDVSVWCWKKGFSNRNPFNGNRMTLEEMVLNYFAGMSQTSVGTALIVQGSDEHTIAATGLPGIHAQPSTVAAPPVATTANALLKGIDQVFPLQSLRHRCIKRLSVRKCVAIPPGQIYKFHVMYRMPQGLPIDFSTNGGYPEFCGFDRFVMLKWSTQMGTVSSVLESAHLAEKVHIVVGRTASIKGTMVQRVPLVKAQLVYTHDGDLGVGTNFRQSAVSEHAQVMEVTKSAQQLEQVP
jgi:hypothetical protein